MTIPATEQKRPPATILYHTTPFTVFKTLLWAEFAPRHRMLRNIAALLAVVCLLKFVQTFDFGLGVSREESAMPFDDMLEKLVQWLAVIGLVYCAPNRSHDGVALQTPWQSLALPVPLHWQVLATLLFQIMAALLLGTCWGLFLHLDDGHPPFFFPVICLPTLAVQMQAAVLWCAAAGIARGLALFGAGLAAAILPVAALVLANASPVVTFVGAAAALFTAGCFWSYCAARAIRGDSVPGIGLPRLAVLTRFHERRLARSLQKVRFSSPFIAQVWFEWRRTARWIAAASAVGAAVLLVLDGPYIFTRGVSMFGIPDDSHGWWPGRNLGYFWIPLIFWFAHIAVTKPYRGFVLTRPHAIPTVSAAKLLAAFMAAIPFTLVLELSGWCYAQLLHGEAMSEAADSPLWSLAGSLALSSVVVYLYLASGPMVFAVMPVVMLLSFPLFVPGDSGPDPLAALDASRLPHNTLFVALALLPLAIAFGLLARRFPVRSSRFPWEPAAALAVLFAFSGTGLTERLSTGSHLGLTGMLVIGPALSCLAVIRYGWRTDILSSRQRSVALVLFTGLLVATGVGVYPLSSTSIVSDCAIAGYIGALVGCTVVFYPMALHMQRDESLLDIPENLLHWALFLISPYAWVAWQIIGADLFKRRTRT